MSDIMLVLIMFALLVGGNAVAFLGSRFYGLRQAARVLKKEKDERLKEQFIRWMPKLPPHSNCRCVMTKKVEPHKDAMSEEDLEELLHEVKPSEE